ncbi:glycosyltransferase family 61 protein [Spirosoma gilvum]
MINRFRSILGKLLELTLRLTGIRVLTKEQTDAFLKPYRVASHSSNRIRLADVPNAVNPSQLIFHQSEAVTQPAYVWDYSKPSKKIRLLPYGSVFIKPNLLCTNFGNHHLLENLTSWRNRKSYSAKTVIIPWSHYVDGIAYGGYYDFVILVAAQLCRIKDALPGQVFSEALVSYPLFNTSYEREFLNLIGVTNDRLIDSSRYAVEADRFITGNNGHWFYPNVADILSLKKQVEAQLKPVQKAHNRVYISRKGRRRIVNEPDLIRMLERYQFTIIEDTPRTVAEQVDIYKNAAFIMGPHGASFTNIIWCEPGTHLFELFSPNYAPPHFQYLASVMHMDYSAYYQGDTEGNQHAGLEENISVSVDEVERCLSRLLSNEYV